MQFSSAVAVQYHFGCELMQYTSIVAVMMWYGQCTHFVGTMGYAWQIDVGVTKAFELLQSAVVAEVCAKF